MTKTEALSKKLKALQGYTGYDNGQMATKLHVCPRTWLKRVADPGSMTVDELLRIEKAFNVSLLNIEVKM